MGERHRTKEARAFYNSQAWIDAREAFIISKNGLCEQCGRPGRIIHHKTHLNPDNVGDWNVSLNPESLMCLCIECHNTEHAGGDKTKRKGGTWSRYLGAASCSTHGTGDSPRGAESDG